jgi:hypothetical protein
MVDKIIELTFGEQRSARIDDEQCVQAEEDFA